MKSYLIIFTLALVLFGFFFVEHHLDTPGRTAADRETLMSDGSGIAARIAAVGQIKTAQAQSSTTTQVASTTEAAVDGQKVYQSACIACHGAGVAGAPMVGNAATWADRIAAGNDSLYANAIDGLVGSSGVMPAKGGNPTLSDAEVKAAVDHMVSQSQ
jgi:cytochrome c5